LPAVHERGLSIQFWTNLPFSNIGFHGYPSMVLLHRVEPEAEPESVDNVKLGVRMSTDPLLHKLPTRLFQSISRVPFSRVPTDIIPTSSIGRVVVTMYQGY
jgi:hypothetical protein